MRRCARFLFTMREISSRYTDMLSCLQSDSFHDVIEATKASADTMLKRKRLGLVRQHCSSGPI